VREVLLALHAPEQELDGAVGLRLGLLGEPRLLQEQPERIPHGAGIPVAGGGILLQRAFQKGGEELAGRPALQGRHVDGLLAQLVDDGGGGVALHRRVAGDQLVERAAESEDIGGRAEFAAAEMLRRHIAQGAGGRVLAAPDASHQLGQAEIHDARTLVLVQQHVAGVEVEVNHVLLVGRGDAVQDRSDQRADPLQRQGAVLAQDVAQRLALYVLEDQVGQSPELAGVVDEYDVGMAQPARDASLQRRAAVLVQPSQFRFARVQQLDGDQALQRRVVSQVDRALGAPAEPLLHLESADTLLLLFFHAAPTAGPGGNPVTIPWPRNGSPALFASHRILAAAQFTT